MTDWELAEQRHREVIAVLTRIADALEAKPAKTGPFAGIPLVYAWLPEAAPEPLPTRRWCGHPIPSSSATLQFPCDLPPDHVGPYHEHHDVFRNLIARLPQGEPVPFIDKPQRCYSEIHAIASAPDLTGLPIRCHLSQDHEGDHEAEDGTSLFRWRVEGSTVICTPLAHPGEPKP